MKVFISWSGTLSKKIAECLKTWLPCFIQSIEPFCSTEDIEKGVNWNQKLTTELNNTHFGIVCLTNENVSAPWIHFEAGAISKLVDSKISVLQIGLNVSDIKGPLSTFQATKFEKDDFYKLLESINNSSESHLNPSTLKTCFEAQWDNFQKAIDDIITKSKSKVKKNEEKRSDTEILEEVLELVRTQTSILTNPQKLIDLRLGYRNENGITEDFLMELYDFTQRFIYFNENSSSFSIRFIEEYFYMIRKLVRHFEPWDRRFERLYYEFMEGKRRKPIKKAD